MSSLRSVETMPSIPSIGARNLKQGVYTVAATYQQPENMYTMPYLDPIRIYPGPIYLIATGLTRLRPLHLTTAYLLLARILVP